LYLSYLSANITLAQAMQLSFNSLPVRVPHC